MTVDPAEGPPDWSAMHPPIGRRVLAVALSAALVALGAACSSDREAASAPAFGTVPSTVPTGPLPPPLATTAQVPIDTVAMVGDSITVGSQPELEQAFAGIGLSDVEINAEAGRRMVKASSITSGLDGIEQVMEDGATPDVWVIALGTNDVANYEPQQYAGVIGQLLAALPPKAKIVWVDCYLSKYKQRSQEFDTVLRQVLDSRGNAKVVDWASVAAEDGVLEDGVHPSGFGRGEFSQRVAETVSDWMS